MSEATWTRAGENLVSHRGGNYYLRAKVAGKGIRECLGTADLRIAKLKRDDRLAAIRSSTLADAANVLQSEMLDRPGVAEKTKDY